jgi:hypothetical protein
MDSDADTVYSIGADACADANAVAGAANASASTDACADANAVASAANTLQSIPLEIAYMIACMSVKAYASMLLVRRDYAFSQSLLVAARRHLTALKIAYK